MSLTWKNFPSFIILQGICTVLLSLRSHRGFTTFFQLMPMGFPGWICVLYQSIPAVPIPQALVSILLLFESQGSDVTFLAYFFHTNANIPGLSGSLNPRACSQASCHLGHVYKHRCVYRLPAWYGCKHGSNNMIVQFVCISISLLWTLFTFLLLFNLFVIYVLTCLVN